MLCQKCGVRLASVRVAQFVDNTLSEIYLCSHCTEEKEHADANTSINLNSFIAGLLGLVAGPGQLIYGRQDDQGNENDTITIKGKSCDFCGLTFDEFQKAGKMGCGHCYDAFGGRMEILLKRIHGSSVHTGRTPPHIAREMTALGELASLKESLAAAVKIEDYEKAAEIRDRIKSLEVV